MRTIPGLVLVLGWTTVGGDEHIGEVTDLDSNVVYVRDKDGREHCTDATEAQIEAISAYRAIARRLPAQPGGRV